MENTSTTWNHCHDSAPRGLDGGECEYEQRLIEPSVAMLNPPRPLNDVTSSASLGRFPQSLCTQGHLVSDR